MRWPPSSSKNIVRVALILMAIAGALNLFTGGLRLLTDNNAYSAVDLKQRHGEIRHWFAGDEVYSAIRSATYPPASYVMLWPLLGWLDLTASRWLWLIVSLLALAGTSRIAIRESRASPGWQTVFCMLLPISMNAAGVTLGNGQLGSVVLLALLWGICLLDSRRSGLSELAAAALLLAALCKPSLTAPYYWIVLFRVRRIGALLGIGVGYLALTAFASGYQYGLLATMVAWSHKAVEMSDWAGLNLSYANLHSWVGTLGRLSWAGPLSLGVFAAQGIWTYRNRRADLWLHLGVAAIVSRIWTYHAPYDDVILLPVLIALFRSTLSADTPRRHAFATMLLAVTTAAMIAPAGRLWAARVPLPLLLSIGHTLVWAVCLLFFLAEARRGRHGERYASPAS